MHKCGTSVSMTISKKLQPTNVSQHHGETHLPADLPSIAEMHECIECLWGVVEDVLPQMGKVVLQDYERLNRGAILARSILNRSKTSAERKR